MGEGAEGDVLVVRVPKEGLLLQLRSGSSGEERENWNEVYMQTIKPSDMVEDNSG